MIAKQGDTIIIIMNDPRQSEQDIGRDSPNDLFQRAGESERHGAVKGFDVIGKLIFSVSIYICRTEKELIIKVSLTNITAMNVTRKSALQRVGTKENFITTVEYLRANDANGWNVVKVTLSSLSTGDGLLPQIVTMGDERWDEFISEWKSSSPCSPALTTARKILRDLSWTKVMEWAAEVRRIEEEQARIIIGLHWCRTIHATVNEADDLEKKCSEFLRWIERIWKCPSEKKAWKRLHTELERAEIIWLVDNVQDDKRFVAWRALT